MKYTVDRFEGEYAVLEEFDTSNLINVLKSELPYEACEGDILEFTNGIYIILKEETVQRKESLKDRFERLRKK